MLLHCKLSESHSVFKMINGKMTNISGTSFLNPIFFLLFIILPVFSAVLFRFNLISFVWSVWTCGDMKICGDGCNRPDE